MNIVVIGGGKPERFGNDFCNRARADGHDVYVISHKDYGTNDPKHNGTIRVIWNDAPDKYLTGAY